METHAAHQNGFRNAFMHSETDSQISQGDHLLGCPTLRQMYNRLGSTFRRAYAGNYPAFHAHHPCQFSSFVARQAKSRTEVLTLVYSVESHLTSQASVVMPHYAENDHCVCSQLSAVAPLLNHLRIGVYPFNPLVSGESKHDRQLDQRPFVSTIAESCHCGVDSHPHSASASSGSVRHDRQS